MSSSATARCYRSKICGYLRSLVTHMFLVYEQRLMYILSGSCEAEFYDASQRKFIRRSALPIPGPGPAGEQSNGALNSAPGDSAILDNVTVLLLDSIGELASLYRLADGAFVGGSLVPSGGHNILEPAAFGKVPVFGPSMENFAEIASRFVSAGAAIQVESPEDVGVAWIESLRNPERMKE